MFGMICFNLYYWSQRCTIDSIAVCFEIAYSISLAVEREREKVRDGTK